MVNASIDHQRRYYEKNKVSLDALEGTERSVEPAESSLDEREVGDLIKAAVANLPERCRLIFVLSRYESYSYKQIANDLDISIKTVENQMTKALRILREKLKTVRQG